MIKYNVLENEGEKRARKKPKKSKAGASIVKIPIQRNTRDEKSRSRTATNLKDDVKVSSDKKPIKHQ